MSPGDSHGIPFHPNNDDLVSEPCLDFLMGQISMVGTVPYFSSFFSLASPDDALCDGWLLDGTGYLTCRLSSLWFLYFDRLPFALLK